jgi:hypothetical protein
MIYLTSNRISQGGAIAGAIRYVIAIPAEVKITKRNIMSIPKPFQFRMMLPYLFKITLAHAPQLYMA